MHPKAIEAAQLAEVKKQRRQEQQEVLKAAQREWRAELKELKKKHNLRFEHRKPDGWMCQEKKVPAMTVAYTNNGTSLVQFSTSICSPMDTFTKLQGELYAARRFDEGAYATLHASEQNAGVVMMRILAV
jgi:hypothetical protein